MFPADIIGENGVRDEEEKDLTTELLVRFECLRDFEKTKVCFASEDLISLQVSILFVQNLFSE